MLHACVNAPAATGMLLEGGYADPDGGVEMRAPDEEPARKGALPIAVE